MIYKIQGKIQAKVRGVLDIIPGDVGEGPGPEPIVPIFEDDFEDGTLDKWSSPINIGVQTYAALGIPAPPDGGVYGVKSTATNGNAQVLIDDTTDLWVVTQNRLQNADKSNIMRLTNVAFDRDEQVFLTAARILSIDGELGSKVYANNTWYNFKIHYKIGITDGAIEAWYDDGAGWVKDIEELNIGTSGNPLNKVFMGIARTGQLNTYWDNFKIYDEDPG